MKGAIFGKRRESESDRRLIRLLNFLSEKEIVLPREIDIILGNLSVKEKEKIIKKFVFLGHEFEDGILIFNSEAKPFKQIREKDILSYLIRPEYVNTEKQHVQIGSQFYSGIFASGFPAVVLKNWLGKLTSEKGNVDYSIHITPSSVKSLETYLNYQLKQVENDLYRYTKKGIHNPSLENRKKELLEQLNSIIRGDYKLYRISLYLASKAESVSESEKLKEKVLSVLNSEGIESDEGLYMQEKVMRSVIPTATDYLPSSQIMVPGPAAAASFPFSSSFYDPDEDGVLLGFNSNNIPIVKSMWKLDKYIGAVLGSSGSGKSYTSKAFILNEQMISGTKTFILDPEGEYIDMAKNIPGSQVISLDKSSKTIPNIFDLMGSDFIDKVASLPKVFDVLLEGISDTQKPILEDAIIETYKRKGIVEENKKSWTKKCPRLSDLYKTLEDKAKKIKDDRLRSDIDVLLAKLGRYTRGIFKFVDQSDHDINMNSPFIVFEFKNMTEEIRPIMMLVLLEFIKTKFNVDDERKLLVLDEAWRMLKSRYEAEYIENFARTFRKRRGALLLITQSVSELKGSSEGKAFLANTSFRYILKTENIVLDETCELFGLNENEKKILSNARTGQGVLIWANKHYDVNVKVDPKTHEIITTNPEEKSKKKVI